MRGAPRPRPALVPRQGGLLGLERLDTIDFFAPVLDAPLIGWEHGHRLAVDAFARLSPTLAAHAEAFFAEHRIDAEPRIGKRFGGFCTWPSTRSTGFLYLNWTGSLLDLVMTKVLDTAILYVFVRGALTRYEQNAYALRARGETLTPERLNDLCDTELAKLWGDAVTDAHGVRMIGARAKLPKRAERHVLSR